MASCKHTLLVIFAVVLQLLACIEATVSGVPEMTAADAADPEAPILMHEHVRKEEAKAWATAKAKEEAERHATVSVTKDHETASATAEATGHAEAKAKGFAKAEASAKEHKKKKAKHEAEAEAKKQAEEKAHDIALSHAEKKAKDKAVEDAVKLAEHKALLDATSKAGLLAKEKAKGQKEAEAGAQEQPTMGKKDESGSEEIPQESNLQSNQPLWPYLVLGLLLGSLWVWLLIEASKGGVGPQDASAREVEHRDTPYVAI
eukprot:CAMPEP_0197644496 /NCGR_PEP_ID=MMETSP1338-20131121/17450_1 /TAXON_ID=43686 ORGANISM="Pelagodinium beii, Strain RCC1491" /NCGR_SAMPLE_ID=MMETSP1338 /ASSEMBLY_ACC=CAM_ASM_000754 /LENGTH=259 /DNA_ID=CAMNT_0043217899 /DNA_START=81 /DNA_END=860 /DNA_ORIENTATION=+